MSDRTSTRRRPQRLRGTAPKTVLVLACVGFAGCPLGRKHSQEHIHITTVTAPEVRVEARVAHRLVISPPPVDGPGRLLVLRLRVESLEAEALIFNPARLALTLAGGGNARILDRPRAAALIDRLPLAPPITADTEHNASPTASAGSHTHERALRDRVKKQLLGIGATSRDRPLAGYLVVDTRSPVLSLAGATLNIVFRRARSRTPVRVGYRFPPVPGRGATEQKVRRQAPTGG